MIAFLVGNVAILKARLAVFFQKLKDARFTLFVWGLIVATAVYAVCEQVMGYLLKVARLMKEKEAPIPPEKEGLYRAS